jgi:hypothetical protein
MQQTVGYVEVADALFAGQNVVEIAVITQTF